MDIGEPRREIWIEPIDEPRRIEEPAPDPIEMPVEVPA
jgi:hypothetical protein